MFGLTFCTLLALHYCKQRQEETTDWVYEAQEQVVYVASCTERRSYCMKAKSEQ